MFINDVWLIGVKKNITNYNIYTMKKFTLLFLSLLLTLGATAQSQTYTITPSVGSYNKAGWRSSWVSTSTEIPATQISVSGGVNNMNAGATQGFEMAVGTNSPSTWNVSVRPDYSIVSYSFKYVSKTENQNLNITVGDETVESSFEPQILSVNNVNASTTSFQLSGSNHAIIVTDFQLTVVPSGVSVVNSSSDFQNNKIYTFVTERGWMGAKEGVDNVISTAYSGNGVTGSADDPNFQWAVYKSRKGALYLYNIGKQMFMGIQDSNNGAIPFVAEPVSNTLTFKASGSTAYPIMFSVNGTGVVNHSTTIQPGLVNWSGGWNNANDTGSNHQIVCVGELPTDVLSTITRSVAIYEHDDLVLRKEDLRLLIENVIIWDQIYKMIGTGVGQKSSSNENFPYDFLDMTIFHDAINDETPIEDIEAKIVEMQALMATLDYNMPVSGKAYKFKSVQADGETFCWFTYNETTGKIELTQDETLATAFVCRQLENGKYAFAMNAGKYMIWRGKSAGGNSCKGVVDTYSDTWAQFTIEKMGTVNGNDLSTKRYVTLNGRRSETDANNEFNYFVIQKNGGNDYPVFDQANAIFYNENYSSALIMEDATYANTPVLNNVGTSALMTSDLHNKAMATFSAPFPTLIPEGVKAYYGIDKVSYVTLKEIGEPAIPAETGVILIGDNAGKVTMVPAAGEQVGEYEENVLSHSAGASKDITDGYILTAKNGVAAFYRANAGTLAMNKAYIAVSGAQEAVEIRLPGTTGVDELIEQRAESKVIFDLTGRKVDAVTAPGVYIVNGKKVLVK